MDNPTTFELVLCQTDTLYQEIIMGLNRYPLTPRPVGADNRSVPEVKKLVAIWRPSQDGRKITYHMTLHPEDLGLGGVVLMAADAWHWWDVQRHMCQASRHRERRICGGDGVWWDLSPVLACVVAGHAINAVRGDQRHMTGLGDAARWLRRNLTFAQRAKVTGLHAEDPVNLEETKHILRWHKSGLDPGAIALIQERPEEDVAAIITSAGHHPHPWVD